MVRRSYTIGVKKVNNQSYQKQIKKSFTNSKKKKELTNIHPQNNMLSSYGFFCFKYKVQLSLFHFYRSSVTFETNF